MLQIRDVLRSDFFNSGDMSSLTTTAHPIRASQLITFDLEYLIVIDGQLDVLGVEFIPRESCVDTAPIQLLQLRLIVLRERQVMPSPEVLLVLLVDVQALVDLCN
jgi:hypothetical protein